MDNPDDFPIDPDLEDEILIKGQAGLHKLAKMLGTFRRELEAEGFDDEEAYALTEAWMIEAMCEAMESEDE